MKTRFKLLICVVAAAVLSTGAVAAAATISGSSWALSDEAKARVAAVELRNTPEWREAFEEALLEGKAPVDPVYAASFGVTTGSDEIAPVYLDPVSPASTSTEIGLEKVYDEKDYGYNVWSGRFVVPDVKSFAQTFPEPHTMNCKVLTGANGSLDYKTGYSTNYKELTGKYTYQETSKKAYVTVNKNGTTWVPNALSTYNGSGKLIEKAYYFYVYRGDKNAEYWDVVVIHVVDKDYAASAEYAAKPYAGLIGHYTYVDTESMGVLPDVDKE